MSELFKNIEKFKNKIALVDQHNKKYSYKYISEKIKYIQSKIKKSSVILVVASNNVESIIGYMSFIRSKNISVLLDKSFKVEYVNKIIKNYKPNYIFFPKGYFNCQTKFQKIISGKDYILARTHYKKYKNINKKNLLLLSTSGTTQNPKFVRLSNLNLTTNTKNIIEYLNIDSKQITITTMPMAYSYGLSIINSHLHAGSKIIVNNNSMFEKKFWEKMSYYKVNSFGGVPQFYEQLQKLKFENLNTKYLKYITQAGGKLKNAQIDYFSRVCIKEKIKFYIMYGQTEASPRMSYLSPEKLILKKGSIGQPLVDTKFYLVNENKKKILKPFTNGELVFKGNNVSLGYSKNLKDLEKGDENKSILYTGDIAFKDKDNFFYIVGRKNRFIKIFGIRYNLDDIEDILKKNKINAICLSKDDKLNINLKKNFNEEKIKQILFDSFKIRKTEILVSKIQEKNIITGFKSI